MDSGGAGRALSKDYSIDGLKYAFGKLQIVLYMFLSNLIRNQSFNLSLQLRFSLSFLIVEFPFYSSSEGKKNFMAHNQPMKNVFCDVSFLSEILEGFRSYLSLGLSSRGSFFSRAANVKLLLQDIQ